MMLRGMFVFNLVLVRVAQDGVALVVKLVRHGMLAYPVVSLHLIQLEALVWLVLQQALDEIARALLDDVWKGVLRVDDAAVRFALLVTLEWRRALYVVKALVSRFIKTFENLHKAAQSIRRQRSSCQPWSCTLSARSSPAASSPACRTWSRVALTAFALTSQNRRV